MKIDTNDLPYSLSLHFIKLLERITDDHDTGNITINFRDPKYSADRGGYHPVEIRISNGQIEYITDFCYVGLGQDAELVKEIDFDFSARVFGHLYSPDKPIAEGSDLFEIWQANFLAYIDMNIFTITLTTD